MLNPSNNRLDYGSILTPPVNYELDFAIATTYSLDLDSLVGASISLGLSQETDSDLMDNPIFVLEALRRTGDKIALFCEAGQIHLPSKTTKLYLLLDQVVNQVKTNYKDKKTAYPSFHPKLWLLRYKNDENKIIYRILVLSRNLTFDRNWDISFTMDGKLSNKKQNNDSLIAFVKYLTEFSTNQEKTDKINQIIKELPFIKFNLNNKSFYDFDLIPEGVDSNFSIKNYPLFNENFDELLIMSPFLASNTIKQFNLRASNKNCILITQKNSLAKLKVEDCTNFEIYTLKEEIIDGESFINEEGEEIQQQDIHAKMFIIRNNNLVDIYLGSLNASHNALNGNIEFVVRLRSKGGQDAFNHLVNDIFNGDKDGAESPFELVDISKIIHEDVEKNNKLDSIIKEIIRLNPKGKIIENNNNYDMEILFKDYSSKFNIEIRPLLSNKSAPLTKKVIITNLEKLQLSQFIVIKVSNDEEKVERVIKIPVEGMPLKREEELITSIVKNEESFINYVAFLLGGDIFTMITTNDSPISEGNFTGFSSLNTNGLYEKMLKTAYQDPKKFDEINFLINSITEEGIIPEGFEELYNTFKKVVD